MADVSEPAKADVPTRKSKRKAASKAKESIEEQSSVSVTENENKDDNKETQKAESPSRSTSSPDPNCAICLSKLENKSFTDSCFHMFCFVCLLEWSKIKAECPLCKQPFKSIIHNVRSYDDYDQYHLERPENQFSYDNQNERRFRYRTTLTHDHIFGFRPRSRYSQYTDPIASLLTTTPTTITTRQHWRRQRQAATSEFRRRIYGNGMRVVGLRDASGRSRNVSPDFFASNPATTHRLVPWLNRELNALLYDNEEHVQFALELILDLIKRFSIQSEEFYQHMYPFIGRHTRHFMHEFETFAKSPFCIISYDQKAVYEQQPEFVSDSDSGLSGNDSDVMIVSPSSAPAEPRRHRRDPGAVRQHNPRTEITPISLSLRDLLEEEDEPITAHSGWESPIPGPSWNLNAETSMSASNLLQPGTSTQSSHHERKKKKKSSKVKIEGDDSDSTKQDSDTNWVDSDSESGSDVVCTGYDKPWQERTPVIVSTDSEEEKMIEKAERAKHRKERLAKKEDESKRNKKRKSRSRSRSNSRSKRRGRSRSSSRYTHRRSRTRSRSTSRSRHRHKSSTSRSHRSRSRSSSRFQRYRSPSPYSRSRQRKRNHSRSIAYEDAFGYSRKTAVSPESSRRKRKRDRYRSSRYSESSRSRSRTPTRHRRDRYHSSRQSRNRRRSSSSSVEIMSSRHRHKKHKKHKRGRESDKERENEETVHYKIVSDKDGIRKSKGDPLLSITIKRDKSEDIPVVSSTVDSAHAEIEMPENVVIRTEPITPPHPGETTTETLAHTSEPTHSSEPPQNSKSPILNENAKPKNGDSDSSTDCVEVRRKSFKKHPSGHKKSRRPLPRLPDPSTSTVTSSTSVSNSNQRMPVLDTISQLFHGYNSPNITSTQVDEDSVIPGMMANFFDSRLCHLYGYPPLLSDFLPRPTVPQVTSSEHPLVLSSSDDSDVVVESVKNGSGQTVSSTSSSGRGQGYQGLMYNILDRIPVISEDISSHKSIDVEEAIDVEELDDSPTPSKPIPSGTVMEVMDSDEELDVSDLSKPNQQSSHAKPAEDSLGVKIPETGSSRTSSPPALSGKGASFCGIASSSAKEDNSSEGLVNSVVNGRRSCDENQIVDVVTCDSVEPCTSVDGIKSCESSTSNPAENKEPCVTNDESADEDVLAPSAGQVDSSFHNTTNATSKGKSNVEHKGGSSGKSTDMDVVGEAETPDPNQEINQEDVNFSVVEETSQDGFEETVSSEHVKDLNPDKKSQELADDHLAQADSSANIPAVTESVLDVSTDINVSSSTCAQYLKGSLPNGYISSGEDSKSEKKSSSDTTDSSGSSYNTTQSPVMEGEVNLTPKPQIVEGASDISSEEESFVQMNQPKPIPDASDISSEEESYEDDTVPANSQANPHVIADDTSPDEGEILSDSDTQEDVVYDVSDVSLESDHSDSSSYSRECSSKGNSTHASVTDRQYGSDSRSDKYGAQSYQALSMSSNYQTSPEEATVGATPDSRTERRLMGRESQEAAKDESRSSGELSDDSSDREQVYDDISSSENFDSPGSPTDRDMDKKLPSPTSSAVHTREEESLSEGEIVSD